MQEKFALKKTLRKVAAVGTSIAMVGVTLSGALAVGTLGDYPSPFTKNAGETVVLWGSSTDDAATQDVLAGLPGGSVTTPGKPVITPGKVVYGLNSVGDQKVDDLFRKGDKEDPTVGTLLNVSSEFGSTLQDNQVDGLLDSSVNIDIGSTSDDYTFHEEVFFNGAATNGSSVETGLTYDRSEEWKERVFVQVPSNSFGYKFKFDKALKQGNYLANATTDDPVIISFLGQSLETNSATATALTANVGQQHVLAAGDSVVVSVGGVQRTVSLKGTSSSNKADVEVDGVRDVVPQDSTRTFRFPNGKNVQVRAEDVFDEDGVVNDRATLIVGEDARKTFNDGDEYIGEDEDDPIWVWNLVNLTGTNPTLEVFNAFGVDHWDETENPAVKHSLYTGDYLCLPNNYVCLLFEGMSEADETFQQYRIKDATRTLSNEDSDATKRENVRVLEFSAIGVSDQGFVAGGVDSDTIVMGINETQITFNRKEQDGSEYIQFANMSINAVFDDNVGIKNINDVFTFDFKSTSVPVDVSWGNLSTTRNGNITLDFGTADTAAGTAGLDGNVIITFENATTTGIEYFGDTDSDTAVANDVRYNNMGTMYDISGKEENMRTKHGLIIYDPKASQSADELKLALPGDVSDYKALLRVARPKEGAVAGSGTVVKSSSVVMMDKDVTDLTAYNIIAVGGPCVNQATRQLLNLDAATPVCGDATTLSVGDSMVELKANGAKSALLVYGWEADDTRRAAVLLKDPAVFKQKLTEAGKSAQTSVSVKGTDLSLSGITVA